jgi:hypothetical protein
MIAAREKYKNKALSIEKALSDCFLSFCDPRKNGLFETQSSHALTEYAYHLAQYNIQEAEQIYCNIPYLNIRCSICLVGELLTEYGMFSNPTVKQYYDVIFRYAQTLSQYGNALFSILYYSGFEHAKQQIDDLLSAGRWNKPWICTKLLYQMKDDDEDNDNALSFHKLAENELSSTVAVQTVKNKNLAFYSEGNGRIRSVDTITFAVHETIIRTLAMRPLNITASDDGRWLAVGYDDCTVEIIRLQFDEKNALRLSESIKRLSYFLPMYNNGVFGFNGNFFWYQKDETTLTKTDLSGETNDTEIYLEHTGELSSVLFGQNSVIFSIRQPDKTVLFTLNMSDLKTVATKFVQSADITDCTPLNNGNIAVSFTNNTLLILNLYLEEQASLMLDAPVVAALALETQLYLILNVRNKLQSVLWDFTTNTKSDILLDNTITRIAQISVKQNDDNSLFLISDGIICKFVLSDKGTDSQKSEIIAADYIASNLVFVTEKDEYLTIISNDIVKKLPEPFSGQWRTALFAHNRVYAFNNGTGYMLSLDDGQLTAVDLKSYQNIACVGNDDYLYFYDITRKLRCLQSGFSLDLSAYRLTSVSLYSCDNYIVLAGTSNDAESGMLKERGNESAPFLILFYEITAGGNLHFVGNRHFLRSKGKILSVAKSEENNRFYVIFCTPNTGKIKEPPEIAYGTIDDFLNQREKEKILHCNKNHVSMVCANNSLLVCSQGQIIEYDIEGLEHRATMAAEKPFRFVKQIRSLSSGVLAVCGKNEIIIININKI